MYIYTRFGDNGIVDIGALGVGVKPCNYVQAPRLYLKTIKPAQGTAIDVIDNCMSGNKVERLNQ